MGVHPVLMRLLMNLLRFDYETYGRKIYGAGIVGSFVLSSPSCRFLCCLSAVDECPSSRTINSAAVASRCASLLGTPLVESGGGDEGRLSVDWLGSASPFVLESFSRCRG